MTSTEPSRELGGPRRPRLHVPSVHRKPVLPLLMIAGALGAAPASGQTETATAFGLAQYPRNDLAVGYEVDALWPRRPLRHPWGEVSGVAVDRRGRIWSLDRGDVPVQVFDREGQLLQAWGQGRFRRPHQIELDRQGNVWVVDAGAHVVSKFTAEGKPLLTLGTPGTPGDDNRHFNQPTDLAITPQGHLFVSDGYGNNRVVHFDADGRYVHSWGYLGSGPGQFSLPHAIAIDSRERLYVADRNNARVQVFDQRGAFLAQWCNLVVPWHIEIARDDSVYVCGSSPMRWGKLPLPGVVLGVPPKDQLVMRLDTAGRVRELWTFPLGKDRAGELEWVHGLAVDVRGDLYLGDIQGRRLQRFVRLVPLASPQASSDPAP